MGRKDDAKKAIGEWLDLAGRFQDEARAIRGNPGLSPRGRADALSALNARYAPESERLRKAAVNAVESASRELRDKWASSASSRLSDATYQASLSKACAALRAGALDAYDVQGIAAMFAGDHIAQMQLAKAAEGTAMERAVTGAVSGGIDRGRSIGNLDRIAASLREKMTLDGFEADPAPFQGADMKIISMSSHIGYLDKCADDCSISER